MKRIIYLSILLILPGFILSETSKTLRLLTINIWSGVDYEGVWRFGEYETEERREQRFLSLLQQVRDLEPDIIFIQEENFLNRYVTRLADSLSFDVIQQVVNAGIKFGRIGIPTNFKEGVAILAQPSLRLKKTDAWKLSGSPGIHSAGLTVHFDETVFALLGTISLGGTPVYLINVHLHSAPPDDPVIYENINKYLQNGLIDRSEYESTLKRWKKGRDRREREVKRLLNRINRLPDSAPVIIAGDFNADPDSPEIKNFIEKGKLIDTYEFGGKNRLYTWDAEQNFNTDYSKETFDPLQGGSGRSILFSAGDGVSRRIDYIFLNNRFNPENIMRSAVAIDSIVYGVYASDHFGMFAEVDISPFIYLHNQKPYSIASSVRPDMDLLPILMYDTDIGFGYGGKAFFLNHLKWKESFDIIAFNSTKGERWYRLVFSVPDFELRQGKYYPFAFDVIVDYDKWIHNSFFGIGNTSRYEDREFYSREPFEISGMINRGFTPYFVGKLGLKYTSIRNFNFEDSSTIYSLPPALNTGTVRYASLSMGLRYDTRDSYVNPSQGIVIDSKVEFVPEILFNNVSLINSSLSFQHYLVLFYPKTVLATRVIGKSVTGSDLPIQVLVPIGGTGTLRGYPQDRYLDKNAAIANIEIRFPLYWRFGGVAGYDAGTVSNNASGILKGKLITNPVAGLRFYMDTFVVRLDVGFGKETTGLYFNFGHLF